MIDDQAKRSVVIGRFVAPRGLEHAGIEPTSENGWASWWCRWCDSTCASDWPCDHCADVAVDDAT